MHHEQATRQTSNNKRKRNQKQNGTKNKTRNTKKNRKKNKKKNSAISACTRQSKKDLIIPPSRCPPLRYVCSQNLTSLSIWGFGLQKIRNSARYSQSLSTTNQQQQQPGHTHSQPPIYLSCSVFTYNLSQDSTTHYYMNKNSSDEIIVQWLASYEA